MRIPYRALAACAGFFLLFTAGGTTLGGCVIVENDGLFPIDSTQDPFPNLVGRPIVPLDNRGISVTFSYVELGTPGKAAVHQALDLNIIPMGNSIYGYGFETTDRGFLLAYRVFGKSKSDSTGIYIVGKFNGSNATLDSTATLWLPQYPTKGASWLLREGRKMEVVSTDTAVWTSIVFANDSDSTAVIRNGLQRQPAVLFQETAGDTLTHYYFRPGVGCVAFRRAIGGHLAASGILKSFSYGL